MHLFCYDVTSRVDFLGKKPPLVSLISLFWSLGHCAAVGMLLEAQGAIFGSVQGSTGMCLRLGCVKPAPGHSLHRAVAPQSLEHLSKDRHESRPLPLSTRTFRKIIGGKNNS